LAAFRQTQRLKQRLNLVKPGGCLVLLYHRVIDSLHDPFRLCVSPKNFNEQLSYLRYKYVFIDIDEFCYTIEQGKNFPPRSLLITFDDGYWDNSAIALPILESLSIHAVFYLATRQLKHQELFWWDELELRFAALETATLNRLMPLFHCDTVPQLFQAYLKSCKTANSKVVRDDLLGNISNGNPLSQDTIDQYRYMNSKELKNMMESRYATIGAHTVNHLSLGHLPGQSQRQEIGDSVDDLEFWTGRKIEHFSFPFGEIHNYNETTLRLCREFKFRSVAAVAPGIVNTTSSKHAFPRFVVTDIAPELLHEQLKANSV
ncbi:MAG: polysaccharide deacetylase family protein, partial [Saprospiraceae bacterium]